MELEPAGARLKVYVAWTDVDGALSGDAHVFVAEQTVDGLRFVDPQSGSPDVEWFFQCGTSVQWLRMDTLKPTKLLRR